MKKLIAFILCFLSLHTFAQDLNCRVQILSPQIQNTNKKALDDLQITISEFLNNRKWADFELKSQERIDCNLVITLKNWDGGSNFQGEAQVLSSRPVFGSSYNTTLLNLNDKNFDFNYTEGQPLDYSEQSYQNNLSSMLAFYAYIIIGFDSDSFSKLGGATYYTKAQTIVNNAQNAPFPGWKAFENLKNRYWLVENINNKSFLPIRNILYSYHRLGLDIMSEDIIKGRKVIAETLPQLAELDKQKQSSMLNQVFFLAKADEIVDIFSKGNPMERTKIYNLMVDADPTNTSKYEELKKIK
ncbi:type IX secretion system protein PorD [Pedobacter arcticus]|uniref:type IX secretion system protein PorD n=1 Tax=Pedobacter arcticus TaxID=752140 RepID=UPI0002DDC13F|nr:DUF4835 family protein [Pedobacter arcticus]